MYTYLIIYRHVARLLDEYKYIYNNTIINFTLLNFSVFRKRKIMLLKMLLGIK